MDRRPTPHRAALASLLCAVIAGCATPPPAPRIEPYLRDDLFAATAERIDPAEAFAPSEEMKRFLHSALAHDMRVKGRLEGLVDAVYREDRLKLVYDSGATRNAAQAFADRRGNCLSLVLMTAAFARELDLPVTYELVHADEVWNRADDLLVMNAHVNISLGIRAVDAQEHTGSSRGVTIDFLPSAYAHGLPATPIPEATVAAMYMNNRAAEALAADQFDRAYAWAAAAVRQAPDFAAAHNTLAVIYLRHGDLEPARVELSRLLEHDPDNRTVLSNLAVTLARLGRGAEAQAIGERLAKVEPYPPFHFFRLGTEAMRRGEYEAARSLFRREVDRADYNSEFHYWLGLAELRLGEVSAARRQIAIALQNSTTDREHDLYAAKLERLRAREAR